MTISYRNTTARLEVSRILLSVSGGLILKTWCQIFVSILRTEAGKSRILHESFPYNGNLTENIRVIRGRKLREDKQRVLDDTKSFTYFVDLITYVHDNCTMKLRKTKPKVIDAKAYLE